MPVKSLQELTKVIPGIVGARSGLRMVLHPKNRHFPVSYAFHSVVIEVKVRDLKFLGTWYAIRASADRKTVILARNQHALGVEIAHRLIAAAMSVGQFFSFGTVGERQQLVP